MNKMEFKSLLIHIRAVELNHIFNIQSNTETNYTLQMKTRDSIATQGMDGYN